MCVCGRRHEGFRVCEGIGLLRRVGMRKLDDAVLCCFFVVVVCVCCYCRVVHPPPTSPPFRSVMHSVRKSKMVYVHTL